VISKNEEVGVSKKLSFLKIDECDPGDVCWIVLKNYSKPILATIQSKIEIENAVHVLTNNDGYRTVACAHAFWEEKDAKEFKKVNKNNL